MKDTDGIGSKVQEAQPAYGIPTSPLGLIYRSRRGISRVAFNKLAKAIKRSVVELAEVLPSSYSTLTKKAIFDRATSEHIIKIEELYRYGTEVFGDLGLFNSWLDIAVPSFEDATPFSLLDTSFGIDMIYQELYKIDYGLPV